uniref:Uncharacterized protein n=1 Tax=Acrobeloides nanus TaxID=290746 RepID=A0A914BVS5_9BILA
MTINQYNRTSPHIKCVNPNGGSVYLVFYNNGSQVAALGSSNGTIDTQVICSTENYLWVFVNNGSSTARIDTVSCIYGSSSANTTKAPSTAAPTTSNYSNFYVFADYGEGKEEK